MKPLVFLDFDDVLAIHREHDSRKVELAFKTDSLDDVLELWQWVFHYSARINLQTLHEEFGPRVCHQLIADAISRSFTNCRSAATNRSGFRR